ncbi:MAG TPA: 50S ribosomal protein L4 [Candidatus Acidoferrales bacterium]|nr:50S ribosomal protein L4 [Candidatus Acidoferrales bacterium]
MPVVDVINLDGKTVGQLELSDEVFAAKINPHLLHETVRHHLASRRAGTHKTKAKGEVSGAGRKLWRQKGTGRARIGSIRSPLWRKGGTVHGPQPRSYDYALPRQMQAGALRSALTAKLADEKLTVVEAWSLDSHRTKLFREKLTKLDDASRTMLLVDSGAQNTNLERASRNLEGVTLVEATALEPYDLLRHERLLLSRPAAEKLSRALRVTKSGDAASEPVQIRPAAASKFPSEADLKPAKASARKAAPKAAKPQAAKAKKAESKHKTAKPKGKKD